MNKDKEDKKDYDFSFKDVEKQVDEHFEEKSKKEKKIVKTHHISDRIKEGLKIKQNLPEKDFIKVEAEEVTVEKEHVDEEENKIKDSERKIRIKHTDITGEVNEELTNGLFSIDLNNDAYWWFIRTPTVMPQLIDQSVRTHIDIKKAYKPEKRKIEIPYLLIIGFIVGALIITICLISLFMS